MSVKVVSVRVKDNIPKVGSVSYGNQINVKMGSSQDYKVKSVGFGEPAKSLKDLTDVDVNDPVQNEVLVFNEITQKYESKALDETEVTISNLDAGIF